MRTHIRLNAQWFGEAITNCYRIMRCPMCVDVKYNSIEKSPLVVIGRYMLWVTGNYVYIHFIWHCVPSLVPHRQKYGLHPNLILPANALTTSISIIWEFMHWHRVRDRINQYYLQTCCNSVPFNTTKIWPHCAFDGGEDYGQISSQKS